LTLARHAIPSAQRACAVTDAESRAARANAAVRSTLTFGGSFGTPRFSGAPICFETKGARARTYPRRGDGIVGRIEPWFA
jgi:hypothetical protein